ncbi:MAG: haloacid dehalogenase type II [Bacteroidales bacterium]|nr:haloacid dehalogenase type II [Bacteroidales bacterium]MCF8391080.1 haloacid dehalogenase type II [Bacteroidales bacterium]
MAYQVLSFDCYGTLIDWKQGVLKALLSLLDEFQIEMTKEEVFLLFLALDAELESETYRNYKAILEEIMKGFSKKLGLNLQENDLQILSSSIPDWPLYSDTVQTLFALKEKYKLAIISNVDNDLFAKTNTQIGIEFDYVITAEDLKSYKPSVRNFTAALEIFGIEKENLLHCAQSIYHDIVPCSQLGIDHVWINRYNENIGERMNIMPEKEFKTLAELIGYLL